MNDKAFMDEVSANAFAGAADCGAFSSPCPADTRASHGHVFDGLTVARVVSSQCRGWNVNEVVFTEANWKTFSPMMRDDFTLFDEYKYAPPPAHVGAAFPIPIQAKYCTKDRRCKKHHLEKWANFTTLKDSFTCEETPGNHLFFYDVPARAKWMEGVIAKLPKEFQPAKEIS